MTEPDDRRIDEAGRRRIAEFVHAAMGWAGMNASKKFTGTGRISKATIDRVKRGDDVSPTLLRGLGDVLELPRDYLLYIGYGDVGRIERLADTEDPNRQDLIRWTLDHLFPDHPTPTRDSHTA
jgi:hypothetical protein